MRTFTLHYTLKRANFSFSSLLFLGTLFVGIHPFVQAQDNCVDVQSVDINPGGDDSSPFGFTAVGDKVFFRAFDPTLGRELFIYDCSANPGMELDTVDINPGGGGSSPLGFTAVGDKVFFEAFDPTLGRELRIASCFSEDEAGFIYPSEVCFGDANPTATITGITGGSFSVDNGATIDAVTGELDLSSTTTGTTYTITYTSNNTGLVVLLTR